MSSPIMVEGLAEFRRNLKRLDSQLPKAMRLAGNAAAEIVVSAAKPRVPLGPGKGGHARDSIRAASTQTAARIRAGGKRFSYYPWLDFGGSVGRNNSVKRPFLKEGRYIWKAYDDKSAEATDKYRDELIRLAESVDFEVT